MVEVVEVIKNNTVIERVERNSSVIEVYKGLPGDPSFDLVLKTAARNPDLIIAGTVTRDSNGTAISAPVIWPDGSAGTYTALVLSSSFPGSVDSYNVTYDGIPSKTFIQPTITRDSNGAVTAVPEIVVT